MYMSNYLSGGTEAAEDVVLVHPLEQVADPKGSDLIGALIGCRGGVLLRLLLLLLHGRLLLGPPGLGRLSGLLLLLRHHHPLLRRLLVLLRLLIRRNRSS